MRTGGCTVQQALTPEAAGVVKQAVSLARRRGNAQVTPLHVASTMLSSPTGLLRAACLQSHSHPLQCKALELCFNVALNRLPASAAAAPLLGPHHPHHHYYPPSLSNALVAAFKRAQAHQRRGSIESQQQPMLAVKIELEQLIISILDDPSVSRVMREAGFSSTQVKANVEQAVSTVEANNPCSSTTPQNPSPNPSPSSNKPSTTTTPPQETKTEPLDPVREEDVATVLDCLASRSKKRFVVVAECLATTEAVVRAAMDRIKKGEAHEVLASLHFINFTVSSFRDMPREEVERRLAELRCLLKSCAGARGGVVLILEDLKWVAEFWAGYVEKGRRGYYCAVEHVVMELRTLACSGEGGGGGGGNNGLWLVGVGTYQTYMRCRAGRPSLENLWGLQTLTVPTGSLTLSLNCDSASLLPFNQTTKAKCGRNGNGSTSCWSLLDGSGAAVVESSSQLMSCCGGDCSGAVKFDAKTSRLSQLPGSSQYCRDGSIMSSLPSWLQQCRDQEPLQLKDLCKKWSSICSSSSHRMTLNFSTVVSPSSSISSYDQQYLHQPHHQQPWLLTALEAKHPWKAEYDDVNEGVDVEEVAVKQPLKSHDHSGSSNGSVKVEHCRSKFKELNAENLKVLCGTLQKEVPWQKEIIPEIASTVLRCRSGMAKRHGKLKCAGAKEETWLFFLGGDTDGKERIARELASLVFGSRKNFVSVGISASSSSRSDSTEEHRNKRSWSEASQTYLERLYEGIREKPHRVILMEDMEQADRYCQLGIKEAIESGVVRSYTGDEVGVGDAIIILSCESFDSRSRACSPPTKHMKVETISEELKDQEQTSEKQVLIGSSSCFDLNLSVEKEVEECCFNDVGLLKAVDRTLFFRLPEDL